MTELTPWSDDRDQVQAIPTGPYDVIVVDPPWAYGSAGTGRTRTAEHHYQTIGNGGKEVNRKTGAGIANIADTFPVPDVAAPSAALYLWATNPKLPFAFDLMQMWGFTYKTTLTWVKTTKAGAVHGGGMGWFYRGATEHVLLGTKGGYGIPSAFRVPNVLLAPKTTHSAKPDEFYDLMDRVAPSQSKIDVFARRERAGWDVWGNEVPAPSGPSGDED